MSPMRKRPHWYACNPGKLSYQL